MNDVPLETRQNDTWAQHFTWVNPISGTVRPDMTSPIDLTGYQATLQVSASSGEGAAVLLSVTSPTDAEIVVQPPDDVTSLPILGLVALHVTPAQTATLPVRRCWWGLEVTNGTDRYTLGAGPLFVRRKAVA